jgi:hypothetical protein
MISWSLPIIETKESILSTYILSGSLGFRDGSLLKDISDGKFYLISDSKRRHIIEPDVLIWMNSSIIEVSQKEILSHAEGDPLDG